MTTILAILAGLIFYRHSVIWALAVVVLIGLLQASTKSAMNAQARQGITHGLPASMAIEAISNRLTVVNMLASFLIWGMVAYSMVIVLR
jgi:hypothetical protein